MIRLPDTPDPSVSEFIAARTDCELALQETIAEHLRAFTARTGVGVQSVDVLMVDTTNIGSRFRESACTSVHIEASL